MPEYSTWRNFAGQGSSTQGRAAIQLPTVKVTENPTKVTERTVKRGTFHSCISRPDSVGKNTTENTCRDASFIQLGSFSVVICATVFRNFQFNWVSTRAVHEKRKDANPCLFRTAIVGEGRKAWVARLHLWSRIVWLMQTLLLLCQSAVPWLAFVQHCCIETRTLPP